MANFDSAILRPLANEGGYVDNPADPGGETYKGIARRSNSDWEGWARIDQYKADPAWPSMLGGDTTLHKMVLERYRLKYWLVINGSMIKSQDIADELLDMAIHLGTRRAVIFLQRALNALNRRGTLWPDVVVDGNFGRGTTDVLMKYESIEAPNFLLKALVLQRGSFYIDRVLEHEQSEDFLRGWLRRIVVQR